MYLSPRIYESTAVVQITGGGSVSLRDPDASGDAPSPFPPFLEKEMTHLTSPEVMRRAVVKGAFDKRWGMTEEAAVAEMGRSVRVSRIRASDVISIRAISVFREDAPEMAEAVVNGYQEDRREREIKNTEQALEYLKQLAKDQEAKVEEKRKKLSESVRNKDLLHRPDPLDLNGETPSNFDRELEKLQSAKLKLVKEKVSTSMEDPTLVVHEFPQVPLKPEGPDVMKYLLPCMAGGLGVGLIFGLLLVLLFPKKVMG